MSDKTIRAGVITPSEATMKVGEKKTFTVAGDTIRTTYATNGKISIDAATQTSTSVTVTAMVEGEDTLNIIFVNSGTASVPIRIVSGSSSGGGGGSATVPVTGIVVDAWSVDLKVGQTRQLVASVVPSNATNQTINWWSQNQSVATVSQGGLITAKSEGYSLVTATTDDGGHSYNVHVNVSASSSGGGGSTTVPVTGVSLNKSSTSLTVGKTEILTATVTPTNATNKAVTWSSNNTTVATVDNGTIRANAKGSATITVRTSDGNKTATCAVTVTDATTPTPTPPTNNAPTISFVLVSNETSSGGYTLSYTATDPNGDTLTHKLKLDAGGYSAISPTKSGTSYTFNGSGLSVGTHTGQIQVSDGSLTATSEVFNITIRAQATGVKAQLKEAKDIYDEKHTALKTTINSVIADGKFNEANEKSQLDQAFSAYNSALAQFKKMAQKAIDFIGDAKKDTAIDESKVYTNAQIKVVSDSITQRVDRVEEKQTSVDGKVSALETWKSSAEQKITADAIINTVSSTITQAKNEAIDEANANTTNALKNYPTTTQMNSVIQQKADSINATVSSNYTDLNGKIQSANTAITQTADKIASKVDSNGVKSIIEQSPDSVKVGFNEISNAVVMSSTGIRMNSTAGAYTQFSSGGMDSYDNRGNQTLGLRNGGLTFYASNNHEYVGYISQSFIDTQERNGVVIGLTHYGDYLALGTSEDVDPNQGFYRPSWILLSRYEDKVENVNYGINMYQDLYMHDYSLRNSQIKYDGFKRNKNDYISFYTINSTSSSELNLELADDSSTYFNILANNYNDGSKYIARFNYAKGTTASNVGIHFYRALNCHGYNITNVGNMSVYTLAAEDLAVNDIRVAAPYALCALDDKEQTTLSVVKSVDDVIEANGVATVTNGRAEVTLPDGLAFTDYYVHVTPNKVAAVAVTERGDSSFVIETNSEEEIEVFYTIKAFQPQRVAREAIYGELQGEDGTNTATYEEEIK